MKVGTILSVIAAFSIVGAAFALSSRRARKPSASSITKSSNNNSKKSVPQNKVGLDILVDSAREYYGRGDYNKAEIFYERVLEIEPNHIETLNGKGLLLYSAGDYSKARNYFEKVLKVDPKNTVALNNIEIILRRS